MRRVLVTGAAGFIGFHLTRRLLAGGCSVLGLDDLCHTYDPSLKEARLAVLRACAGFDFRRVDIAERSAMGGVFDRDYDAVFHLAAHAGVRRSVEAPRDYLRANIDGFVEVLEGCRDRVGHLVYASSSSVYGLDSGQGCHEGAPLRSPTSPYAATKVANEALAHAWSHLHGTRATGLRFFTVYGPWGRPDMALFKFADALHEGRALPVYNHGRMARDFTYVDDVVEAIVRVAALPPECHRVLNVGSGRPVPLSVFIDALETATGVQAERLLLPMQAGDVVATCADISQLRALTGFSPSTPLLQGVTRFTEWHRGWRSRGCRAPTESRAPGRLAR